MQALGLIETRGLLSAIECADVMLKTAQVELVGRTFVGGGLVTIAVTGDVGAVKAAVEAGRAAVEKIGHLLLISQHVIPRPHPDIESIVAVRVKTAEEQENPVTQQEKSNFLPDDIQILITDGSLSNQDTIAAGTEPVKTIKERTDFSQIMLKELHKKGIDAFIGEFGLEKSVNVLQSLSVVKLRNLAREYKELGIAGRDISKANKDTLIQKLKEYYVKGSEK